MLQEHFAHASDLRVPTVPPKFERAGETVNAYRIDVLHHAALAHQSHPLRVHRAARPEHGFLSALPRPMRRAAYHFAKDQPVRIERGVPFQWTARLVPKLNPLEKF